MNVLVAGVDEAGRGPLAGPVVAAAVIFRRGRGIAGVADSKCSMRRRARAPRRGDSPPRAVFRHRLGRRGRDRRAQHTRGDLLAMRRAVLALSVVPDCSRSTATGCRARGARQCTGARSIVRGDASRPVISAASILAKTARDAYMLRADTLYPAYQFAAHKGYGTEAHLRLLREFGPSPMHRRSFSPTGWRACWRAP
jgi:ribonuclease HII